MDDIFNFLNVTFNTGPGSLIEVGSMDLRLLEPNFSLPRSEYMGLVRMRELAFFPINRVFKMYVPGPGVSVVSSKGGRELVPKLTNKDR